MKLGQRKLGKEILKLKLQIEIVNSEIMELNEKKKEMQEHLWNLERLENEN